MPERLKPVVYPPACGPAYYPRKAIDSVCHRCNSKQYVIKPLWSNWKRRLAQNRNVVRSNRTRGICSSGRVWFIAAACRAGAPPGLRWFESILLHRLEGSPNGMALRWKRPKGHERSTRSPSVGAFGHVGKPTPLETGQAARLGEFDPLRLRFWKCGRNGQLHRT